MRRLMAAFVVLALALLSALCDPRPEAEPVAEPASAHFDDDDAHVDTRAPEQTWSQ